jgi:coronin-1B/1C/6
VLVPCRKRVFYQSPFFSCGFAKRVSDGNIRYYEYANDKFEYLSEYSSPDPQRGIAFLPKRGINLHDNEVLRCFKTVKDGYVEPISFIVPRRSEMFQSDIYPPCTGLNPGTTAAEWFGGKTALPPKISLESVYDGGAPEEVPAETKAPSASASAPVQSPPPTKVEAPAPMPVASREPPPSLRDNKQSLASQASKFADKDGDVSDDDASSFEEISKPVQRHTVTAAKQEAKTMGPVITKEPEQPKPTFTPTAAAVKAPPPPEATSSPAPSATPGAAAGAAAGIKDHLTDIKSTLQEQNKVLSDQSDQIALLMREVSQMKTKVGVQSVDHEKDERIRQLELELEEARS